MGTIEQKLTYLNDTKQLLKENINNLGGNLTNEPFRQYASVLEGIYERIPKVSGIGASLSLSPSLMGKIKLNEIQGNTLQNGTPTPSSPVPIQSVTGLQNVEICGKNILDYSTMVDGNVTSTGTIFINTSNGEMCSDFIRVKPNTKYTFKIFETSSTYDNWFGVGEYTSNNENSFIQRDTTNNVSQNYITFTTTATTNYVRLSGRNLKSATKVQFELGNATTYEPYKGNTYEVNLGKNLLNPNGTTTNINGILFTNNGDGTFHAYGTATANTNFALTTSNLILNNNTTYTQSVKTINGTQVGSIVPSFKDSNGTINWNYFYNNQTKTTTDRMSLYQYNYYVPNGSQVDWTFSVMIEKGSQATSYSPYFTPYEFNGIGDYENYIFKNEPNNPNYDSNLTLNSWYIQKNIGEVVFDGSETWTRLGTGTTPYKYYTNKSEFVGLPTTTGALSTHFVYDGVKSSSELYRIFYFNMSSGQTTANGNITFTTSDITSKDNFVTWLTSNNVKVLYTLKTPIYEVITNTELIEQLESLNNAKSEDGTTNINVTSEDLSMILNVGVLKGE